MAFEAVLALGLTGEALAGLDISRVGPPNPAAARPTRYVLAPPTPQPYSPDSRVIVDARSVRGVRWWWRVHGLRPPATNLPERSLRE